MADDEEARLRRAKRLREELARLRKGEPREPSSPRDFAEREARREKERKKKEEGSGPADPPPR